MRILVAYESRYGATEGIARRIGEVLIQQGLSADVVRARDARSVEGYDAFVIGSAVFIGSWMREAVDFVKRNAPALAARPAWLFSSGPIGDEKVDPRGRDVKESAVPKTIAELQKLLAPRGHAVFFGALDRKKLRLPDSLIMGMPAFAKYDGDFRDWDDITGWAEMVAGELAPVAAASTLEP